MSKGMKKIKKEIATKGEESSIEIIVNLLRYVNGVNYDRVIFKFKENKNEKIYIISDIIFIEILLYMYITIRNVCFYL